MHSEERFREVIFRVFVKNKMWADDAAKAVKIFCVEKKLAKATKMKASYGMSPKTVKTPPKINGKRVRDAFGVQPKNLFEHDLDESDALQKTPRKKQKLDEE